MVGTCTMLDSVCGGGQEQRCETLSLWIPPMVPVHVSVKLHAERRTLLRVIQ
jgi:hypothetical protein